MFNEVTHPHHPLWTGRYYNEGMSGAIATTAGIGASAAKAGASETELSDKLREECGVFGVFGHAAAAPITYYGLHALQHRGEQSAGICTSDGTRLHYYRDMGLVKEVFDQERLQMLGGSASIGHVRYAPLANNQLENAQPLVFNYKGGELAICMNGSLTNAAQIRYDLEQEGSIFQTTSDTEVVIHLIARSKQPELDSAVQEALQQVSGGFALLIITEEKLFAAVDRYGLRPLVMGSMGEETTIFSSETCAFESVGASYVRDIQPGELLILSRDGAKESRFAKMERRALCAMEYIYFSRPDSDIDGINLHTARKNMGRQLAIEAPVTADVVTGVPDSSISAAIGYAEQTGIPYELGLIKNRYTGRTFIQPSQELREQGVKMKHSAVRKVIEGKRVVLIDDSIVRGTTSLRIVNMLRDVGAKEVHVRISSPPYQNPCFYGIDTPNREDLIASSHSVEQMRVAINADSLHFLSKAGLLAAIGRTDTEFNRGHCTACFDHDYPSTIEVRSEANVRPV